MTHAHPAYRHVDDFPWEAFLRNLDVLVDRAGGRSSFAVATGVSFWTISSWMRRDHAPRLDNLLAIHDVYGVSLDALLYGDVSRGRSR